MRKIVNGFVLIILILGGCTENPFVKNNITDDANRVLSGEVVVGEETDPSGVFVWLKELNLNTWTDKNGNFSFTLPPKPESQPGGGFTGFVTIYYFVANYFLESSRVFIFDGAFKYNDADLNEDGKIRETIVLKEKINIITRVVPNSITLPYGDPIFFSVNLKVGQNEEIRVRTEKNRGGEWTGIFIKSLSDPNRDIDRILSGEMIEEVITGQAIWLLEMTYSSLNLPAGSYEIIPYISISENLPTGLLTAIGNNVRAYDDNYFKYPIRVQTVIFEIK